MNALMPWGLRLYLEKVTGQGQYTILVIGIFAFAAFLIMKVFLQIAWWVAVDKFGGKYMEKLTITLEKHMAETSFAEIEKLPSGTVRNILYMDVLNVFRAIGVNLPSISSCRECPRCRRISKSQESSELLAFAPFYAERTFTLLLLRPISRRRDSRRSGTCR